MSERLPLLASEHVTQDTQLVLKKSPSPETVAQLKTTIKIEGI